MVSYYRIDIDYMTPIVPKLYFLMGWKYGRRPPNPYKAPSGTVTMVPTGKPVPCCADREVFLYLAALAHEMPWTGHPVIVDLRVLRRWLDAGRRLDNCVKHLTRVMSCTILVPLADGIKRAVTIGTMRELPAHRFLVHFSREFIAECADGIPYSPETAARLRSHPAIFDLYLALLGFVHEIGEYDEFTHEYPTYAHVPLQTRIRDARRALCKRLEALRGMLPGVHASMAPDGTNILIDLGRPRRTAHAGGSPETWKLRQDFARLIRAMPPTERRRFGQAIQRLAAYERQFAEPMPWADMLDVLQQAETQTARSMARVDRMRESLPDRLEDTTGPIAR